MATWQFFERYKVLAEASRLLRKASTIEQVLEILRCQARSLAGSDGVAVIRREGDRVAYIGEDAITPLWSGQSFPIEHCVSGLAILAREPILIPDIRTDERVPLNLYLSTFVRSMAVFPLGSPVPIAALGLYWREPKALERDLVVLVSMLASGANAAFQTVAVGEEKGRSAPRASAA